MQKQTQRITLSALFIALSVLLPIIFHSLGLGSVFLPMFWPITAAAFFLTLPYAIGVGVLAPLVSSFLTGMPPVSPPILQILMVELAVLAFVTSLLYSKTRLGLFWVVLLGLLFSRVALLLVVVVMAPLFGLPPQLFSIAMVAKGLPGVLLLLIIIPLLVGRLEHQSIFSRR